MIELTYQKNIESYIQENSNLDALGDCLDKTANEYLELKKRKASLDFGTTLDSPGLQDLFEEVKTRTEQFLCVKDIPETACFKGCVPTPTKIWLAASSCVVASGFLFSNSLVTGGIIIAGGFSFGLSLIFAGEYLSSYYDNEKKRIGIRNKEKANAAGVIAHEYTHHIQETKTIMEKKEDFFNPICEGHARGVQIAVSRMYAQEHDNPAYIYRALKKSAIELKSAYMFACRKSNRKPSKALKKLAVPEKRFGYWSEGHHYRIGVAAMQIAELKHGSEVYSRVAHNDFSFLAV
ncbi:MAG: hypothetical protein WC852_07430 [Candidatus Nanoarchaeia archaeon]|jgi:hypothetical protein